MTDAPVTRNHDPPHLTRGDIRVLEAHRGRRSMLEAPRRDVAEPHQQGRQQHTDRDDAHRDDECGIVDDPERLSRAEKDKTELTALSQHEGDARRRATRQSEGHADQQEYDQLDGEDQGDMLGKQQRLSRDRLQIDRHADGDEKEAHQQPFEWLDLCLDLKAEARGREQHPHHEAAERHRETRLVHCPGCEKDRQQHHQGKGLAVVLTQQMLEREGHQITPEAEDQGHHAEDDEDLLPEGDVRGQGADIR